MRKGKMSTIIWKSKKRKNREISEDRVEKFLQYQDEKNRPPRRRRKRDGEWKEI
tara:strand:- start:791 stop:952 length:162 start_codon:yes stop_codon:yes gene_type:complete